MGKKGISDTYDKPKVIPVNEKDFEIEEVYCAQFGCGKKLSLIEKLSGSRCLDHMKKENYWLNGDY